MADPFLGEIKLIPWGYAPRYWAFCSGQVLGIAQNQALFALLGTTYGGDGVRTYALPNLQGRSAMHYSPAAPIGTVVGTTTHTLTALEQPIHTHSLSATKTAGTLGTVTAGQWLGGFDSGYGPLKVGSTTTLHASTISTIGNSVPHENRQPWLCMNYVIALSGLFPSRN